jgi:hypothetical protein
MNPRWLVIVLVLTLSALAFGAVYPGRIVYWQEPERIEQFLVQATPLGASQADVQTWLEKQGVTAEIHKAAIPPNSDYPRSRTGGASFIHESIAHFWLPFRTDIEAFYTFNHSGRLVDIRVRRTTDAL